MTHLGLFEGIGGFSLAARWAGWETVAWCEIDQFCQNVLKHHFPEATGHTDIKTTDFTQYANKIDIITGGFPCQPYSMAGKRKGKEDDRHLWPEMLRAIREVKPRWVVGENVYGLVNWNGGVVFDEVQSDLEAEGYEVWAVILPAAAVNAPHRRDRIWIIAHSKSEQGERMQFKQREFSNKKQGEFRGNNSWMGNRPNTNPDSYGQQRFDNNAKNTECNGCLCGEFSEGCTCEREQRNTCTGDNEWIFGKEGVITDNKRKRHAWKEYRETESGINTKNDTRIRWANFPTQSPICSGDDGIPDRLDGITFPKWRNESIKAYGNAIVPQVAYELFKVINQIEQSK